MRYQSKSDSRPPIFLLALVPALSLALILPTMLSAQIPDTFENLQLLPKDIEQRQLIDTMRAFSMALGVRCSHCHVGPENARLSELDFASDEKSAKSSARLMMRMVRNINEGHLAKLEGKEDRLEVSCQTCHRGVERPQFLDDLLVATVANDGIDAAVTRYGELRERYHGGHSYDFSEFVLLQVAEELFETEQPKAARRMIELNAEHHPESSMTEYAFGRLEAETGNPEAAKAHLRRALEYDPKNRAASFLLQKLEAPPETGSGEG